MSQPLRHQEQETSSSMSETTTCPMEAVFGGEDDERYPCTYEKGHDGPHSYVGVNPPSVADLARG